MVGLEANVVHLDYLPDLTSRPHLKASDPHALLQRTVHSVSNDVSRYGYVTPVIHIYPEQDTDYIPCLPAYGTSICNQICFAKLLPGDKVSLFLDPLMKVSRLVSIVSSQTADLSYPARCKHCDTPIMAEDFGIICTDPTCPRRLANRLAYLGSPQGLTIQPFSFEKSVMMVERENWFRSIDQIFEPQFVYHHHTVLDPYDLKLIMQSVNSLKKIFASPATPALVCSATAALINSLSIPGFTHSVIRRFMEQAASTCEDPIPLIIAALERPVMMAQMGIPYAVAVQTAKDGVHFIQELGDIQVSMFEGYFNNHNGHTQGWWS